MPFLCPSIFALQKKLAIFINGGINIMVNIKAIVKKILDKFIENKMKYKYILSMMIIGLSFVLTSFMITEKIFLLRYWDAPSLLSVGILPFFIMCVWFGFSNTKKIFSVPFAKDPPNDLLDEASLFFSMFNKIICVSALLSFIVNCIEILASLSGFSSLGMDYRTALAISLISPLYAVLINLIVIIPYTIIIKRQLKLRK
jgi:hypothetical protein